MKENSTDIYRESEEAALSISMAKLSYDADFHTSTRSSTFRHTIIVSPGIPHSSPSFLQSIKSFEAGEFTIAHSLSFLDSEYCTSSSDTGDIGEEAKTVTFVTRSGEGESSHEFRQRTKRVEVGEYKRVRGVGKEASGEETPKKAFTVKTEEMWKLRKTAQKIRLRHKSNDL